MERRTHEPGTEPRAGTRIGPYTVLRALARGGMARVYLAVQHVLGSRVTLKVLDPELARDPSFVARFVREARLTSGLAHPNVVTVHAYFRERDLHVIVLEYVDGPDLGVLLERVHVVPPEMALLLLGDAARGLAAAHEGGLVHRDVKTENLILSRAGVLKVADFGIVRPVHRREDLERLTAPGCVLGTPGYLAPEQAEGEEPSPAADVFALGVVAHELLSGAPPYAAGTIPQARSWLRGPLPPPRLDHLPGDVAARLGAIVAATRERDPARRPTMRELDARLAQELHRLDPNGYLEAKRTAVLARLAVAPERTAAALAALRHGVTPGAYWQVFEAPASGPSVDVVVNAAAGLGPAAGTAVPPATADPRNAAGPPESGIRGPRAMLPPAVGDPPVPGPYLASGCPPGPRPPFPPATPGTDAPRHTRS